MTIKETKEQIQNDLICLLEGETDQRTIDIACQIIVDRFKTMDGGYTEDDMRRAHKFGTNYMKGTIAEAQSYNIEKLLRT